MRLQELYYLARTARDNWCDPEFKDHQTGGRTGETLMRLENAEKLVTVLEPLGAVPLLKEMIDSVYASSKNFGIKNDFYLSSQNVSNVEASMSRIKEALHTICGMCEALRVPEDAGGFDVKLPSDLTLSELSACTKDLDTVFTQCPLLQCQDGGVKLSGVDVGSVWMTFAVAAAGTVLLKNLAELVDKVVVIRSHWITCKQQEEEARKAGIANDMLESLKNVHKAMLERYLENAMEELSGEHNITDPEEKERLRVSMKLLEDWMGKGMEIHAAIGAPQEIKASFPTVEQQKLFPSIPKLLKEAQEEPQE